MYIYILWIFYISCIVTIVWFTNIKLLFKSQIIFKKKNTFNKISALYLYSIYLMFKNKNSKKSTIVYIIFRYTFNFFFQINFKLVILLLKIFDDIITTIYSTQIFKKKIKYRIYANFILQLKNKIKENILNLNFEIPEKKFTIKSKFKKIEVIHCF